MKKTFAVAMFASVSVLLPAAEIGVTPSSKPSGSPPPNSTRAKLIEKYDTNKDGKLDKTEIEAMRKDREAENLKKYDANKDGKLDEAERKIMREEMRKNLTTPATRPPTKPPGEQPKK